MNLWQFLLGSDQISFVKGSLILVASDFCWNYRCCWGFSPRPSPLASAVQICLCELKNHVAAQLWFPVFLNISSLSVTNDAKHHFYV